MRFRLATALLLNFLLAHSIFAQDKSGSSDQRQILQQILSQTYQPSDVGKHMMGIGSDNDVKKPGTIVVVQREGLFGSLNRNEIASSSIQGADATLYRGHKDYPIPVGERFYVVIVTVSSSAVNIGLLSARSVTTAQGAGRVWSAQAFNFPEKVLASAEKETVFREIDQWFVPEGRSTVSAQPAAPAPAGGIPAAASSGAPVTSAPVQPAPASNLVPGMSRGEVVAALGSPRREVSFQNLRWLHYPAMTVVFTDDKLSSVEQANASAASVTLNSDPPGAEIYLDGQLVGATPSTLQVPAGAHRIALKLGGFGDWIRDVQVLAGSDIHFAPKLAKP